MKNKSQIQDFDFSFLTIIEHSFSNNIKMAFLRITYLSDSQIIILIIDKIRENITTTT